MTAMSKPRVRSGLSVGSYRPLANAPATSLLGHIFDVRFAGGQPLDPYFVEIEADDVEADLNRPHGNREPGVALTDDDHAIGFCRSH